MVRKLKHFIYHVLTYYCLTRSSEFQKFIATSDRPRLILLDTPIHGNLGDQAIVLAEKQFLEKNFPMHDIYEFTQQEYIYCERRIYKSINKDDVILIPGGGFIGTLWQNEEDVFLRILNRFFQNKIVVFPQTVYFEKSEKGMVEEEKLKEALQKCRDFTLFCRDFRSYEFVTQKIGMDIKRCKYVPDIVTSLKYDIELKRKNRVLFCLRNDKEKILDEKILQPIVDELRRKDYQIIYMDTMIGRRISKRNREEKVAQKLNEFAQARLVITDRLHGMLFSAITSTPCIAVDNVSRKVSGGYEWIKDLKYIKCVKECELNVALVADLMEYQGGRYSNANFEEYYRTIEECICRK
ncbi:MAG: hypothetical protein HDR28_03900 [Lachnospiraceae bacterium]|nr:hypothetical protein [Lachnospiraceae bacterium]